MPYHLVLTFVHLSYSRKEYGLIFYRNWFAKALTLQTFRHKEEERVEYVDATNQKKIKMKKTSTDATYQAMKNYLE